MVITMRPCVRCRRRNGFGWHGHDRVSGMVMTIDWGLCLYGYDHDVGMVMIMGEGIAPTPMANLKKPRIKEGITNVTEF